MAAVLDVLPQHYSVQRELTNSGLRERLFQLQGRYGERGILDQCIPGVPPETLKEIFEREKSVRDFQVWRIIEGLTIGVQTLESKFGLIVDREQPQPLRIVNSDSVSLREKIISLCDDLQQFLQAHGSQPEVHRELPESQEAFNKRFRETVPPWNTKFYGDYRAKFLQRVPAIWDKIRAATGVNDFQVDQQIKMAETNPNADVRAVACIMEILWSYALKVGEENGREGKRMYRGA